MRSAALLLILVAACILPVGCGGGKSKVKVEGEVLLDGKPMAQGEISFVEAGEVPEILTVSGGKFSGEITQGDKRVEVRSYKEGKIPPTATIQEAPKINIIPGAFNTNSKLTAKVTGSGVEPTKFEVKSR